VREGPVEDSLKLLEERVHRAAERLAALSAEAQSLHAELAQAKDRASQAEQALAAATDRETGEDASRAELLQREVKVLRREREEIRARVEKLVSLLERL